MFKVVRILLVVGIALATPTYRAQIESLQRGQNQENCICLDQVKNEKDGQTQGEYSYVDPVGSKITVSYTYGVDGAYSERRRVDKNTGGMTTVIQQVKSHQSSGTSQAQRDNVVQEVITQLEATIERLVKTVVTESGSSSTAEVFQRIQTQLKPTILRLVRTTLTKYEVSDLEAADITTTVISQIEPTIREQIERVTTTTQTITTTTTTNNQANRNQADLIAQILFKLKPIIQKTIEETYGPQTTQFPTSSAHQDSVPMVSEVSTVIEDDVNMEKVVSEVITQITPIITETVVQSTDQVNFLSSTSDLVGSIVVTVQPHIQTAIDEVLTADQINLADGELVKLVLARLQGKIRSAIQTSTLGSGADKSLKLEYEVVKALTPIILTQVTSTKAIIFTTATKVTSTTTTSMQESGETEFSTDLVTTIVTNIQPHIQTVVTNVFSDSNQESSNDELVNLMISRLDAKVDDAIRESQTGFSVTKNQRLHTQIVLSLRPVVQATVEAFRVVQTREIHTLVLKPEFTNAVMLEVNGIIETQVEERLGQVVSDLDLNAFTNSFIQDFTIEVEEVIRRVITTKRLQPDSGFFTSQTYKQLLEQILAQVRSLVRTLVQEMQAAETTLIQDVTEEVRSDIAFIVSTTIQENPGSSEGQDQYERIISNKVESALTSVIQSHLPQDVSSARIQRWTRLIFQNLGTIIEAQIRTHISTTVSRAESTVVVDEAFIQIKNDMPEIIIRRIQASPSASREVIIREVTEEIRSNIAKYVPNGASQSQITTWTQEIIVRVESIIGSQVQLHLNQINVAKSTELTAIMVTEVKGNLQSIVEDVFTSKYSSSNIPNEAEAIEAVDFIVKAELRQSFQAATSEHNGKFSGLIQFESEAVNSIVKQFRSSITQYVRQEIQRLRTSSQVTKTETVSTKITSIFGTGGVNTVQVDTPNYQYGYEH